MQVDIREHSPDHWKTIVTVRGRCYYAIYAGDKPSIEAEIRNLADILKTAKGI